MVAVKLKCVGRVRPLYENDHEASELVIVENTSVLVADGPPDDDGRQDFSSYELDHSFGPESTNQEIYDTAIVPLVLRCVDGYNVSCISYGASATGKGHSLFGDGHDHGVMFRAMNELFLRLEQDKSNLYLVSLCMFQVRNEIITDLLCPEIGRELPLCEDRTHGHIVDGISRLVVKNWEQCGEYVNQGLKVMEILLKRSAILGKPHIVAELRIESKNRASVVAPIKHSTFRFVLTAGSGGMMIEADQSLMSFGVVIEALAAQTERHAIAFNSSVMTSLLRQSLGGNACTVLMAHVAPTEAALDDTLRTLSLAHQARSIESEPMVNKSMLAETIQDLRQEIRVAREKLQLERPGKYLHDVDPSLLKHFEGLLNQLKLVKAQTWEQQIQHSRDTEEKRKCTLRDGGLMIVLEEAPPIDEELLRKVTKGRYDLVKQTREVSKAETALEDERIHLETLSQSPVDSSSGDATQQAQLQAEIEASRERIVSMSNTHQHQVEKLRKMRANFSKYINQLVDVEENQRKTFLLPSESNQLRALQEKEDWREIQTLKADERGDPKLTKRLNELQNNCQHDLDSVEQKYADPSLEVTPLMCKQLELDAVEAIFQKSEKLIEMSWERDQVLGRLLENEFRHEAQMSRMQKQMFTVFREYRRHFEEQKRQMEVRFSKMLEDSVRDALKLHQEKTSLQTALITQSATATTPAASATTAQTDNPALSS